MKVAILLAVISMNAMAFEMKEFIQKAAKDKKMQEQAKEVAKKGMEYFKKDGAKDEVKKTDDTEKK